MSEGSFVDLHRRTDRRDVFLGPPVVAFDRALGCWIVTDHGDCEQIIRRHKHCIAPQVEKHERVAASAGVDLGNMNFALRHLPLALNGEAHDAARRAMARHLQARAGPLARHLPAIVARRCRALGEADRIELMSSVVAPLAIDVMAHLSGISVPEGDLLETVSLVFDRLAGIAVRRRADAELARVRALVRAARPDADEAEEGCLVSAFVLGRDSLAGTLGGSLHEVLRANPGRRLDEIDWPEVPVETAVPYTERVACEDIALRGAQIRAGDRMRLYYQGFVYRPGPRSQRLKMFGLADHSCLGKQIALDVWRALAREVGSVGRRFEIEAYELRRADAVFVYPRALTIGLGP